MDKEKTLRKLKREIEEVREKFGIEFAEIVRCGNCKHQDDGMIMWCNKHERAVSFHDFCNCGEQGGSND